MGEGIAAATVRVGAVVGDGDAAGGPQAARRRSKTSSRGVVVMGKMLTASSRTASE
jgi:hypothetical protein